MGKKCRTIGLLVSGIMDPFTESLCRGVIKECRKQGVKVVAFPGKYLDRDLSGQPEIMYEYQFNTIFDYVAPNELEGLIVSAGNIGCFSGEERVQEMLEGYGNIPCVLTASKWDGYVSVNYDNESGVREGMEYLINNLHCRNFAMLAGPDDSTDARERKEAFIRILQENNLPLTKEQIIYASYNRDNPEECNQLLDNNPDVEAIFCVNDDSALGLYEVMRKRGIVPGKDIKILGYDNTPAGAKAQPSLSSVGSDAIRLGEEAVAVLCRMLDGQEVEPVVLPARFVLRNSFGSTYAEEEEDRLRLSEEADDYFDSIFQRYQNIESEDGGRLRLMFKSILEQLLYIADNPGELKEVTPGLMKKMDSFLEYNALEYADMDDLLLRLEYIFQKICGVHSTIDYKYEVRNLFDAIYRRIIHNMDFRASRVNRERYEDVYSMKIFVRDSLQFRKGNDTAYTALFGFMDWLQIYNAYLYVFEEPITHLYQEKFVKPDYVLLKAYLKKGQLNTVPLNRQKIPVQDIFNNEYVEDKRYDFVLLPVFYNEMQYGLLLCDLTDKIYSNGEFLTNQAGAAVHMIELLKENEQIQQQLEETISFLRENNIALDYLSKQDSLTGINNRRGYMEKAKQLIEDNKKWGRDTLVAYVDMNNLKIINDRYGHEEGDYSLCLISQKLTDIVGNDGVVGRIGGDEYSFVLTTTEGMDSESVERRIHALFAAHNRDSDKPYNVTVSIGLYQLSVDENIELEDALSYADEKLYVAKQNKDRTVAKNG